MAVLKLSTLTLHFFVVNDKLVSDGDRNQKSNLSFIEKWWIVVDPGIWFDHVAFK